MRKGGDFVLNRNSNPLTTSSDTCCERATIAPPIPPATMAAADPRLSALVSDVRIIASRLFHR